MNSFGSLFAGIGGIDLGLERAGWQCRWQVEIDPFCQQILAKHWPEVKRYGDIRKLTGNEFKHVDLICGGFPCQDLSQAGKRAGIEGTRSRLWFEFTRIIGVVRPRYVCIENVPGLLVPRAMRRVVGDLARCGYVGAYLCLRASDFGASHLRKRVFIVAYRNRGRCEIERIEGLFDGERAASGDDADGCDPHVAHGKSRGLGELRQPSGCNGLIDGSHAQLGDPQRARWQEAGIGCSQHAGSESEAGCGELGDPAGARQPRRQEFGTDRSNASQEWLWGTEPERGRADLADAGNGLISDPQGRTQGRDRTGSASEILPRFAPGPNDPRWPAILEARPDLAPTLESPLRGMADGIPDWMDRAMSDRTKRLGRLGNAVVPQVAEWIGRRIAAFDERFEKSE